MFLYPSMLLYVINSQFLLIAEGYCTVGRSPNLFIYSPVGGHFWLVSRLGLLLNKAAVNGYGKVFVRTCCRFSWRNRRALARSCDESPFNFLRSRPSAFQRDCAILHSGRSRGEFSWLHVLTDTRRSQSQRVGGGTSLWL